MQRQCFVKRFSGMMFLGEFAVNTYFILLVLWKAIFDFDSQHETAKPRKITSVTTKCRSKIYIRNKPPMLGPI